MWQHLMLNLKCIFCPCCTPETEPRHLFTLHYSEIQTGLNDYKWPLCVLAPTCIRFRLRNLSKEITWDKMDIFKLQACNSKSSVYRFSVSSNPAGEKIVWTWQQRIEKHLLSRAKCFLFWLYWRFKNKIKIKIGYSLLTNQAGGG